MKRTLFFIFQCFLFSVLCSTPTALASAEFETSYNIRYQVQTNGTVNVNQDISLTNRLSSVYATQYSLTIQSPGIQNIKASDAEGPLKIETVKTPEKTVINLTFNQQVVGTGKTLSFNLSYEALDLVQKNGQVWEVFIPKLANPEEIDNFTLELSVPLSFGKPAFINPEPLEQRTEGDFNLYRFAKNQLAASGVSAAFGDFQVFDFILTYHLQNPNLFFGEIQIALPPDTAFQQVFYQKIQPPPINIRVDSDGNWLGKYRLGPNEKLNITAVGKVKIFAQPQEKILPPTSQNLANNLKSQKYWEIDDPLIQTKAKELKTPRAIYNFVVETLDYDFSRVREGVERQGAVEALKNPKRAICMEFTDLYIALARAAGIPAREINGFAYTANPKLRPLSLVADVLHSWPEYWDEEKGVWIPVDPTWGKTTGGINYFDKTDLNHFAFVIHGESSLEPYPAGSYRTEGSLGKDVQVVFGRWEVEEKPELEVKFRLPKKIFSGLPKKGEIIVKNSGAQALYNLELTFKTEKLNLLDPVQGKIHLEVLPPFASRKVEIKIKPAGWLSLGQGTIKVLANNQEFLYSVKIRSLIWHFALPILGLLMLIAFLVVFVLKRKLGWRSKNI